MKGVRFSLKTSTVFVQLQRSHWKVGSNYLMQTREVVKPFSQNDNLITVKSILLFLLKLCSEAHQAHGRSQHNCHRCRQDMRIYNLLVLLDKYDYKCQHKDEELKKKKNLNVAVHYTDSEEVAFSGPR